MKKSVEEGLQKAISYTSYRKLISDLIASGKSSGPIQSEDLLNYSKLNDRRMTRLDKTIHDNTYDTHEYTHNSLREHYDKLVGVVSDVQVKDVTRLCFVSYDPNLYLDQNAEVFKYQSYPNNETKSQKDIYWVWDFTAKRKEFIEGNRNNFVHSFACNANRFDFKMNDVINYAYSYSDNTLTKEENSRSSI